MTKIYLFERVNYNYTQHYIQFVLKCWMSENNGLFGHCHLCNINFANPQQNENGEYVCRQCGQGFVELIDNPHANQHQQQADIFM